MNNLEIIKVNKNKLIAHRGLFSNKNGIPENSLKAFDLAIKNGYSIELDVQLTKDNQLVVFHDENLKRMTGLNEQIRNLSYLELKKLNLLNTKYTIPTFKEVLKLVNGKVSLLIEIKNKTRNDILEIQLMKELSQYYGEYWIQSFNIHSLLKIRKKYPNQKLGILVGDTKKRYRLFPIIHKIDFVSCNINCINDKTISKYHRKNKKVFIWTVKGTHDISKYITKCDQLIFEKFNDNI